MDQRGQKPTVFIFTTAYSPFIGGAEIAISEIAKRLSGKFDFVIVTARMRRDLPKKEIRKEGMVIRVGFGNYFDKFFLPIFSVFAISKLIKNNQTLFFGVDLSFGALAGAIAKFFHPKIPLVFNIQYGYGDERVASGRGGFIGRAFHFILFKADYVTAISTYLFDLAHKYGYTGEEAIIHNGVDFEKFSAARLKDKKISNTIITVSRLVQKNGVDILIKALAELKKDIPDIKLNIVGDGSERQNLEELSQKFGLNSVVKFFGEVTYDDIQKYLAEADIFVRASRFEGMGNVFVEALAAGLPIVGTKAGGITDIIKEGETGLFAKVDDPKDLAEKIKILFSDEKLYKKIVENGQKMVNEKFDWNKITASYEEIFSKRLLTNKRILIVTPLFPPDIGGPATYSRTLLLEFPKRGIGVRVLNFGVVRKYPKVFRHFIYFLKSLRLGKNVHIIFAQDPVSVGLPAMLVAKILRKKFILKVVGDYAWEQGVQRYGVKELLDEFLKKKYGFKVEFLRKIQRRVAHSAETIIVPSEYLKKVVVQWGINPEKIKIIYNAFDLSNSNKLLNGFGEHATLSEQSEARKVKQLITAKQLIVSAGRFVPWKGFDVLIGIMPELIKKFPDLKLVIIGDGPERESLHRFAGKHTIFTGNLTREKVLEYLSIADVFVLNTAYEGFSHQILEAMALGVPVVTTNVGGNLELIQNDESGFLIDFNDKNVFIEKILEILDNPALAHRFTEEAQKKAREFSKERMIRETIKVIEKL